MSEITGAELLWRCLVAEGVKFMLGLPCPEVDPILAKLDEYGVRFVPILHAAEARRLPQLLCDKFQRHAEVEIHNRPDSRDRLLTSGGGGTVYCGSDDGNLYAVGAAVGSRPPL